jgi:tetratricopeptide (TPR) repeat protein
MGAAAGMLVLAVLALFLMHGPPFGPSVPRPGVAPAVAVKPFANLSGDKANDYLGFGIADDLTAKLAQIHSVTVVSRSTIAAYLLEKPNSTTFARDLSASYVIEGGVHRNRDKLHVTFNLIKADGSVASAASYDGSLSDLFILQNRVAQGLADRLDLALTARDRRRLAAAPTTNVEAFADYSQGLLFIEHFDIKGNIDHAIDAFQRAIARDPAFALAHAGLGFAYWKKYTETREAAWTTRAIDCSMEALRLDPSQAEVHVTLGAIHQGLGRRDAAADDLRRALALQPNQVDAHRLLGDLLADQQRTDDAIAEYRQAIAIRPNYWKAHNSLGQFYMTRGRYAEAGDCYRRVAELQPDSVVGFNNLGLVMMMLGDTKQALANFTRAAELSPRASTFSNTGTVHYWEGRYDEARRAYERAIELRPADPQLRGNLGDAWLRLGDRGQARAAYAKALELAANLLKVNPKDAQALSAMAVFETKLGRPADAREHADQAIALMPKDSTVLYRRAVVHALGGEQPAAVTALKEALAQGYSVELARRDEDLATLRGFAEFTALVKR